MARTDDRLSRLWISLGIAVLVLALYGRVLGNDFISLDDEQYVLSNPHVNRGLTWEGLRWAFTATYASNWHPLTWVSHMVDVQLFGLAGGPHHMVSVIFHATNAILLFLALYGMSGALWPSALTAAFFAVHPLRVESVAWVAERKDILAGLFWMLTLLAYTSYAKRPSPARYLRVLAVFALGLMAKPMLVTLPLVLLLLDFWPLGRWRILGPQPQVTGEHSGAPHRGWGGETFAGLALEKVPLLVLSALSSAVTFAAQASAGTVSSLEVLTLPTRLSSAALSYLGYLEKTVWPTRLAVIYPHPALAGPDAAASLIGPAVIAAVILSAVTSAVGVAARRRPHLIVGWLWYLGTLVPVIGLVQVGIQFMADRYSYVPLIGIYLMIAWEAQRLAGRSRLLRTVVGAAAVLTVGILSAITWSQIGFWKDSVTLYRHALSATSNNYLIHVTLGSLLERQGRLDEAAREYEQMLAVYPNYPEGRYNYGVLLAKRGEIARARVQYEEALRLNPRYLEAHNNLAALLASEGDLAGAIAHYETILTIDPSFVSAEYNLGVMRASRGDLEESQACFERALRLAPDHPEILNNLGTVLERRGRLAEAAARYEAAIRARPDYFKAEFNLGVVRMKLGLPGEAAAAFESALRNSPGDPLAHQALASVLFQQGKLGEARDHYERALRIDPGLAEAREGLTRVKQALGAAD